MTELPIVLIIEDEDAIQAIVEDALTEGGFQIATVKTGEEAITLLKGGLMPELSPNLGDGGAGQAAAVMG